jgi:hypothetical protein
MMDPALYFNLASVTRRLRLRRLLMMLAGVWILAAFVGFIVLTTGSEDGWQHSARLGTFLVAVGCATAITLWAGFRNLQDVAPAARLVESRFPELDSALITAIEQKRVRASEPLGYLQTEVVRKAVYHGYLHRWQQIVPGWHLLAGTGLCGLSLVALLTSIFGGFSTLAGTFPDSEDAAASNTLFPPVSEMVIEPGDTEVERGSSVLVLARFPHDAVPGRVELEFSNEDDGNPSVLGMPQSLDDPLFGVRIPSVDRELQYLVRYDGAESKSFRIQVFEYPALVQANAVILPPNPPESQGTTVRDFRRLTAMTDSRLELEFLLNKPVVSARLVGKDGAQLILEPDPANPQRMTLSTVLLESGRFELKLVDAQNRSNKDNPLFFLTALDNQRPEFELLSPRGDTEASPLEEIEMAARVRDDTGISRAGLVWSIIGGESQELELATDAAANKLTLMQYLLQLENSSAGEDDLLTFHFWAEDTGPDGTTRRTNSELFFVEMRPFEQVFRQTEQPAGGEEAAAEGNESVGGNAGQAGEVLDLQKKVVSAIWNVLRRQGAGPDPSLPDDAKTISESQGLALEQLNSLSGMLQDPQSRELAENAATRMAETVEHLAAVARDSLPESLEAASVAAQIAYSLLLGLREREHDVAMSQQRQSQSGGSSSRQQRQLDNLQLQADENRYQTEQQARPESESTEQREDRQLLSRLDELARRQKDLNERIREMQSALEQAETEEEEKELERQLKRLQEEQEQILRDAEELEERMQSEDNRSRMSEQANKLEESRENIQQASEALQNNELSQAVAEGTRAQRQLRDLRNEFQNQTSGQFNERVRQLRNRARDIEAEQNSITEAMSDPDSRAERKKLDDQPGDQSDTSQRLRQQSQKLRDLQTEMQQLVTDAGEIEPVMSDKLYEAWRDAQQSAPVESLEAAASSLQRGRSGDARQLNEQAAEGVRKLREGIDEAAESVLGSESEALRRAGNELERLTGELDREFREETGAQPEENEPANGTVPSGNGENQPKDANDSQPSDKQGEGGGDSKTEQDGQPKDGQPKGGDRNANPDSGEDPGENESAQGGEQPADRSAESDDPADRNANRRDARGRFGANPDLNLQNDDWLRPLSGDDYTDWIDRLRDAEQMLADPELRAEAQRLREQAREIRGEARRHSVPPNWEVVDLRILRPLYELRNRVQEELMKQTDRKSLVPIDRDPVPPRYEDAVREYYEELGRGNR